MVTGKTVLQVCLKLYSVMRCPCSPLASSEGSIDCEVSVKCTYGYLNLLAKLEYFSLKKKKKSCLVSLCLCSDPENKSLNDVIIRL